MSETVVFKCGHCDGKGVCERGSGNWSCATCLNSDGRASSDKKAVKCSVCDGGGSVVKKIS